MNEPTTPDRATELQAHLKRVAEREEGMQIRIEAKLLHLRNRQRDNEVRLLRQAGKATSGAKKVYWLRQAAEAMAEPVFALSACRTGCSHCCNITVPISRVEAEVIARETGARLNKNAGMKMGDESADLQAIVSDMSAIYYGMPCTFLSKGKCSIYESRPLACRLLLNMDDDDFLPPQAHGVPSREWSSLRRDGSSPPKTPSARREQFPPNGLQCASEQLIPRAMPLFGAIEAP